MCTQMQQQLPANAAVLQPNLFPITPQQMQSDNFQQMQQDNSGVEILQPDILPARYGPGPYGCNNTFIDSELTRDHSTLLSSSALKRREDRRHALDQILFGRWFYHSIFFSSSSCHSRSTRSPSAAQRPERETAEVTHIDYFPVYPKHPKDAVSMVGLPGMLKETASTVKAEEHTAATMSAVDVNSREIPSTAQGMGQAELVMGSSDIDADEVVQHQEDLMRGNNDANEAATEHAPRGDSMLNPIDLVESPSAFRFSFQEQSDLSMDGV
jgi:hypothetical protein